MNNFEHILSLSPAELAKLLDSSFCAYPNRENCQNEDCIPCLQQWLTEKHNDSGLTEYEKIHASSLKKFAKDHAHMICMFISTSDEVCKNNPLCLLQPFKCAYSWLNQNYTGRTD